MTTAHFCQYSEEIDITAIYLDRGFMRESKTFVSYHPLFKTCVFNPLFFGPSSNQENAEILNSHSVKSANRSGIFRPIRMRIFKTSTNKDGKGA